MQVESYCEAHKILQLQVLVKQFNLRWMFNPYPVLAQRPEGKWRVGVDYNDVDAEDALKFDLAWQQLESTIKESFKRYSVAHRVKVFLKKAFVR